MRTGCSTVPQHVYVIASDGTRKERNLTPGEFQHHRPSWLRDSSGVVVAAQRHESWDRDLSEDLYVVPLEGEIRALTASHRPVLAPVGVARRHAGRLPAMHDPDLFPQNLHVGVVDLADGGQPEFVSEGLDRTFYCTSNSQGPLWEDDDTSARHRRGPR